MPGIFPLWRKPCQAESEGGLAATLHVPFTSPPGGSARELVASRRSSREPISHHREAEGRIEVGRSGIFQWLRRMPACRRIYRRGCQQELVVERGNLTAVLRRLQNNTTTFMRIGLCSVLRATSKDVSKTGSRVSMFTMS